MKKLFNLLFLLPIAILGFAQETQNEVKTISGLVTEFADSGLGPYYQITVVNETKTDSLSGLILLDLFLDLNEGQLLSQKVKLQYNYTSENWLDSIELKPPRSDKKKKKESSFLAVVGRLETCTCGDMGGYLDLLLPDGEIMSFMTEFYCPEDIYKGDEVIVYYEIQKEVNITGVSLL